jgi:peptide/nickel transport system substrate-binding protein
VYFGLGKPSANTVLPQSTLYKDEYRSAWSRYDLKQANALLDAIGLTKRDEHGIRLLPDGRKMELIIDTAGESTEETDVGELVRDSWRQLGIALFGRPSQREVFRKRVYSGKSMMSAWTGLANGIPTPQMSPAELAPTQQEQLQWPMWGQYYEQSRKGGEAPTLPEAQALVKLYEAWRAADDDVEREQAWHEMLAIHADQVFTIGTVTRALQPVVARNDLRNVPREGIWNWDPGAYFGIYRMDTFWIDTGQKP